MNKKDYKVLIIDDEEMYRLNLVDFFEDDGFIVNSAESAEDGLELMKHNVYDGAIVDMRLPGMDGNQFVLKAYEINSKMKCIIHTGSSNYSIPKELKKIGIRDEYLFLKPLNDMIILANAIKKFIKEEKDE